MSEARRTITKRACDGCKIRKIKCSGLSPCGGCDAVGISCTYLKHPSTRGPRKLRSRTLREIAQTQQQQPPPQRRLERQAEEPPPNDATIIPSENSYIPDFVLIPNQRLPVASLVLHLCVYRFRMFPVWPIVRVEEIIARLQRNEEDIENYALATAVGAATASQLKLTPAALGGDGITAAMMEAECQRTRTLIDKEEAHKLTTLRIAFFLHVYYENQEAGGVKSLLYLREAITLGQMMGMHKESSYLTLSPQEQQMRRRVLWLLFVTERGVSMLHKLPVILKANIAFPSVDRSDETFVLPAFQKLVNLFWIFDQSGAFDILQDSESDIFGLESVESPNRSCIDLLQRRLLEVPVEDESINDIQNADICVTRQWMRAVLWKFSMNHSISPSMSTDQVTSLSYPFQIAKEFLKAISHIPKSAMEAHGQGIELKIYEIASSVTDAIAKNALVGRDLWNSPSAIDRPGEILSQLQRLLSSSRGGNKTLVSMLCQKIAEVQNSQMLLLEPSNRITEEENSPEQWPAESSANLEDRMTYEMGMNLEGMDSHMNISDHTIYQDELGTEIQNFPPGDQRGDNLSPQSSISSTATSNSCHNVTIPDTSSPSSSHRHHHHRHHQQPQQPQQFLPTYPFAWPLGDTASSNLPSSHLSNTLPLPRTNDTTDLYSQIQQNSISGVSSFNGGASNLGNIESVDNAGGIDNRFSDMWAAAAVAGASSGPGIEGWN